MTKLILMVLASCCAGTLLAQQPAASSKPPARPGMKLASSSFEDGGIIPNRYTQADASPVSPQLAWTNVPAGVVSFALIMHDPDAAPMKRVEDILHWMLFNVPGSATGLPEAVPLTPTLPDGTIQAKGFRMVGYMGPGAAAAGPYHHYIWELYALDTKLDLGQAATRAEVLTAMEGHVLAKAVVTGRFHRPPPAQ